MISDPTHAFNYDVILDTLSDGDSGNLVHGWFSDTVEGNPHMSGGDVSRDRRKLAFATGSNDSTPTFSPDGGRLAWSEADGIKIVTVPGFAGGCTTTGATPTAPLVIPGGKNPDWGPANVPGGRGTSGGLAVKSADAKLRKALKKGFTVRVRVPGAGRLSAVAEKGARKVASGSKSVKGGNAAVKLRFTKAAERSLQRAAKVKVRIKVAFKPAGGPVRRTSVSLTLKR